MPRVWRWLLLAAAMCGESLSLRRGSALTAPRRGPIGRRWPAAPVRSPASLLHVGAGAGHSGLSLRSKVPSDGCKEDHSGEVSHAADVSMCRRLAHALADHCGIDHIIGELLVGFLPLRCYVLVTLSSWAASAYEVILSPMGIINFSGSEMLHVIETRAPKMVIAAAFIPHKEIMLLYRWRQTAMFWDPTTGTRIATLPDGSAFSLAPRGDCVAVSNVNRSGTRILHLRSNRSTQQLHPEPGELARYFWKSKFSPDSSMLATLAWVVSVEAVQGWNLETWDVRTGERLCQLYISGDEHIFSLFEGWGFDGASVAVCLGSQTPGFLFDVRPDMCQRLLKSEPCNAVSNSGLRLRFRGRVAMLKELRPTDCGIVREATLAKLPTRLSSMEFAKFSADGRSVLIVFSYKDEPNSKTAEHHIILWAFGHGRDPQFTVIIRGILPEFTFSADSLLITAILNNGVMIWDVASGKHIARFEGDRNAVCVILSAAREI